MLTHEQVSQSEILQGVIGDSPMAGNVDLSKGVWGFLNTNQTTKLTMSKVTTQPESKICPSGEAQQRLRRLWL